MFDLLSSLNHVLEPQPQHSDVVTYTVKVADSKSGPFQDVPRQFQPTSVRVYKAAYRIPYALLSIVDGDVAQRRFEAADSGFYQPGKWIQITAGYRSLEETVFVGLVVRHRLRVLPSQPGMLEVECKDGCVKLSAGRKNRVFFSQSDSDIFRAILREYSADVATGDVDDTLGQHREMVQYHATDWDFLVSRAEASGMLVIADNSRLSIVKPNFEQAAAFPVTYGANLLEFEAEMDARDQYPAAKASTWNPGDQAIRAAEASASGVQGLNGGIGGALALGGVGQQIASAASSLVQPLAANFGVQLPGVPPDTDYSQVMGWSSFDVQHPGHFTSEEVQSWAETQFQKNKLAKLRGRVKFGGVASVAPGTSLRLQGIGLRHEGPVYLTAVTHELSNGAWFTHAQFGLSKDWFAQEFPDVQDMPAAGLLPAVHGLQIGIVTQLQSDPDGENRIQVRLPMVATAGEGIWMRIALQDAGSGRGSFWLPEIGDEVVVGFLNDDPREAIVLGMLHSSAKPAPLTASDQNNEKGWVTRSGIQMLLNDDKKSYLLQTPGGKKILVDDQGDVLSLEDEHGNKITLNAGGITVESAADLTLKAAQNLTIQALNVTAEADANLKTTSGGPMSHEATGNMVVKGAVVQIN